MTSLLIDLLGLSSIQTIKAATLRGAQIMGTGHNTGHIPRDGLADLMLS